MPDFVINPASQPQPKIKIDSTVDTLVHVLVDGSGSMMSIREQTRTGMNEYLSSLPKSTENSKTLVSFSVFSGGFGTENSIQSIRSYVDINDIKEIASSEYIPSGGTPLLDAIGDTIAETALVENSSPTPPAVIFVIITDGAENQSKRFNRDQIKTLIEGKTKENKWTFLYLGANQDSFSEAHLYGIAAGNTTNFNAGAVKEAFGVVGAASAMYASSNSVMRSADKFSKYVSAETFKEAGIDNKKIIDK